MPSSPSTLATAPSSMSVLRVPQIQQQLGEPPVRPDAREDLLVLYLAGHHGCGHAFLVEGLDEPRKLAERKPVNA